MQLEFVYKFCRQDKRDLREQLQAKDRQWREALKGAKMRQAEEVERLRHEFEDRVKEIERRYSAR